MASQNSLSSASRTRKWVCFRERAIGGDPSEKHRLSAGRPCLWQQSYLLPSPGSEYSPASPLPQLLQQYSRGGVGGHSSDSS